MTSEFKSFHQHQVRRPVWIYSHHYNANMLMILLWQYLSVGLDRKQNVALSLNYAVGYSFTKNIGRGGMVIFIGGASEYGSHYSKLFIEHCGTLHSTPLSISLALQAPLLSAQDTFDEQPNTLVHKQGIKPTDKETCKESKTQHLLTNAIYPLYCAAHQLRHASLTCMYD